MKFNANDGMYWLSSEEWIEKKEELKSASAYDTAKFFEQDTGVVHTIYNGNDNVL